MNEPKMDSVASPLAEWSERWLTEARYPGPTLPDADERIERIRKLWQEPIPEGWERHLDRRLLDPSIRYLGHHKATRPRAGSEHELEHQILTSDPARQPIQCLGAAVRDGINAVPLARDRGGSRIGNVEADMLLLTVHHGDRRLVLIEAKTTSNHAWYAAVENLRQLRLFLASPNAQDIFAQRQPDLELPHRLPVTALVLAPPAFYKAQGQKENAVGPALHLLQSVNRAFDLDCRLAIWSATAREISALALPG